MSHRKPNHDTQQGPGRVKDATVPRAARLPTSRHGARQLDPTRPTESSTRMASRSPPLVREEFRPIIDRPRQKKTTIPQPNPRNPVRSSSKNASNLGGMTRSATRPDSQSQEVPLLMDFSRASRGREHASAFADRLDPADGTVVASFDMDRDAIFGTTMPRATTTLRANELPPRLIPELQALAAAGTRLPQTSTKSLSSSSPSTRFSSSPSPWSVSTTTTTPTSFSSASPGIVQQAPLTGYSKRSQTVPLPAGKREKIPQMPALPESIPPPIENEWPAGFQESIKPLTKKRTPLQTPAPTPPPRTSSAKYSLSRSSSKSDRQRTTPLRETPPFSSEPDRSPLARRGRADFNSGAKPLQPETLVRAHDDLQQSLGTTTPRGHPKDLVARGRRRTDSDETYRMPPAVRGPPPAVPEDRGLRRPTQQAQRQERDDFVDYLPNAPQDSEIKVPSSPARSGKFSRLGIFGRRSKSPTSQVQRSPRKLQKGPSAGTGHEGYGRYGKRGRKLSQETESAKGSESERSVSSSRRTPLFPSSSTKSKDRRNENRHNRSSQSDLDDFAATRLKPVPIIGGSGGSVHSNSASQLDIYSTSAPPGPVPGKWESPSLSQSSFGQQSVQSTPPNAPDQFSGSTGVPALAIRRSQRFGSDAEYFNLPTPIRTEGLSAALYINSQDESRSSAFPTSTPSTTTDNNRSEVTLQKSKEKKSRKLRWNIFRRKEADPKPARPTDLLTPSPEELAVSVSAIPVSRSMPYYAVIDSESEFNPNEQVGDYLSQVVESPAISPTVEAYDASFAEAEQQEQIYEDDIFLPSVPLSPPQSFVRSPPPVPLHNQIEQASAPSEPPPQKQPRLVRVGRIPAIGQRSEREHKPSRSSFSQPFVRAPAPDDLYTTMGALDGAPSVPLQINTDVLPSALFASPVADYPASAPTFEATDFMHFPSRQTSDASTSSSSGGVFSILGPALAPGSGTSRRSGLGTSPIQPGSPTFDDVWNEYDDFIDHVMSPSRSRKSAKALSRPSDPIMEDFEFEAEVDEQDPASLAPLTEPNPSDFPLPLMKRPVFAGAPATSATPPVMFPLPKMPERSVGEDIRLRRSRIVTALHSNSSVDLANTFTMRDMVSDQIPPRNRSKVTDSLRTSTAGPSLEGLTMTTSAPDQPPESSHQENVAMLEVVERSKDPVAQSELHYASLMVAKWLSFGRVLFSPAHDDIQNFPERHILVIDGLGNEDWSIYCAVSYEEQRVFVHDLKERTGKKGPRSSRSSQNAPDNHRRAEVANFQERFPFPPAFFSVVVLRFPPAMAETKMRNIVSECRRVLMPGGYLELMLLDLDIVNMGVQTRRIVRELKYRMTTADKQISLRPIIDNVQSVLGSRGFTNISRCVVGVPVAGRPSGSTDSSSSSRSSRASHGSANRASGDQRPGDASPRMAFGQGRRGTHLSLNDLLSDRSDHADLRIGKIVSRTARTWWQHCFEASVISDGNLSQSIFADKHIFSECKGRGSSFKMLIAYAQRPVFETRRRTMSEPVVPSLATAGGKRQPPALTGNPRTA